MKRISDFLKTTAFGGLFVVLPLLLLFLLLAEVMELLVGVSALLFICLNRRMLLRLWRASE